jgi:hypothetical protein
MNLIKLDDSYVRTTAGQPPEIHIFGDSYAAPPVADTLEATPASKMVKCECTSSTRGAAKLPLPLNLIYRRMKIVYM